MTQLLNEIFINAPPEAVWSSLTELDRLHEYDPGVSASKYTGGVRSGVGAARRSEVPGGYFEDVVTEWDESKTLDLELTSCSFPIKSLNHRYSLEPRDGGTLVKQVQNYEMKWGALGKAMDALMIRRKWNAGVRAFLEGLKGHVEGGR